MTDERALAEQALAAYATEGPVFWPRVAERIREARERTGITEAQVAERAGLASASDYWDLELRDDEAFTCVSVGELHRVAAALGTSGAELLFGDTFPLPSVPDDFISIAERVAARIADEGTTPDAFGDGIGWDITEVLTNPAALAAFNVVGFRDVCKAIGVDWIAAFLSAGDEPSKNKMQQSGLARVELRC